MRKISAAHLLPSAPITLRFSLALCLCSWLKPDPLEAGSAPGFWGVLLGHPFTFLALKAIVCQSALSPFSCDLVLHKLSNWLLDRSVRSATGLLLPLLGSWHCLMMGHEGWEVPHALASHAIAQERVPLSQCGPSSLLYPSLHGWWWPRAFHRSGWRSRGSLNRTRSSNVTRANCANKNVNFDKAILTELQFLILVPHLVW